MNDVSYAWDKHVRLLPGESLFAIVGRTAVSLPRRARNFVELSRKRFLLGESLNFELSAEIAPGKRTFIEVEQSIGILEITCNGHGFQPLFAPPYRIEITDCVRRCNEISVELTGMPDADSPFDIEIPRKMDLTFKLMQAE